MYCVMYCVLFSTDYIGFQNKIRMINVHYRPVPDL